MKFHEAEEDYRLDDVHDYQAYSEYQATEDEMTRMARAYGSNLLRYSDVN